MKIHQFSAEEALASLKSRHEGLVTSRSPTPPERVWSQSGRSESEGNHSYSVSSRSLSIFSR